MVSKIKSLLLLTAILLFPNFANAEPINLSTLITIQDVPFERCTQMFKTDAENLFYLTIASINANRFNITEIQSKKGYILFNAVNKEFLASIVKIDPKTAILKITPTNNIYYFQPGIVLNTFKYIELNSNLKPTNLSVI